MNIICSDGAKLRVFENATEEQFENIEKNLSADGFSYYDKRKESEVVFSTFVKGDLVVYLSYTPTERRVRQIFKENAVLFEKGNRKMEQKVTPLITQVRNAYFSVDCGMSYVIRVSDGRFVLIDGGFDEYEEADHLWDVLMSQYEGNDRPIIAAWFITHPHCDHYSGFVKFMNKYGDRVQLESILYNWALAELSQPQSPKNDLTEFNRLIEEWRHKVKVITPRTGQRYEIADAVFDVLFVCEDIYPERIPNVNNTSLVMRMEIAGRRVLWMGDAQGQAADCMCRRYGAESLKCEIFQVGHHGYNGGSDELHRTVDPEVLLWPCPNFWYPVVRLWERNDYLIHSPNIQTTIVSGQKEVVLDMTKPVPVFQPYVQSESDKVVYEECFDGDRVVDLHWSCITGGSTGYGAAEAKLGAGECTLTTVEKDVYTVCEFVQAGQMEVVKNFVLTISGKIEKGTEKFGLFWDYSLPTVFSEEHALWLEENKEGEFRYCLKGDWKHRKAQLTFFDKLVCEFPYETVGGLHFLLKNASVTLQHIQVEKL